MRDEFEIAGVSGGGDVPNVLVRSSNRPALTAPIQIGSNAESASTRKRSSPSSPVSSAQFIGGDTEGRGSQGESANLSIAAATANKIGSNAEGEGSHTGRALHGSRASLATTIDEIREQWRRRQAWHRAEKSLTLQAKALCRRLAGGEIKEADKLYSAALGKGVHPMAEIALAAILPLVEARDSVERHRKLVEKRLAKLAKTLPVAPWVDTVRGFGIASLAAIVGEAGDLSGYTNPAKLWKRMGLAVMADGRQRRVGGAEALVHGYSPGRRSVMWNCGACIIKAGGPLKEVYDTRKAYEAERVETKAHAHNRAQRYIEKRLLRDLWLAWRRVGSDHWICDLHKGAVAPAN